jgi:hypothetical protein
MCVNSVQFTIYEHVTYKYVPFNMPLLAAVTRVDVRLVFSTPCITREENGNLSGVQHERE